MSKKEPTADQPITDAGAAAADEQANVTRAAKAAMAEGRPTIGAQFRAESPAGRISFEHQVTVGRTVKLAEQIALSILRSPHAERFLAGNPIDGHRIDGQSLGTYLAGRSHDLATDFVKSIEVFGAAHLQELVNAQIAADAIAAAQAPASVEQIHEPD